MLKNVIHKVPFLVKESGAEYLKTEIAKIKIIIEFKILCNKLILLGNIALKFNSRQV